MASNPRYRSLLLIITIWTMFVVAASGVTPVGVTVNVTNQVISDGDAPTDDQGRANTDINAVPIRFNARTTVGGYQFTSYFQGDGELLVGRRPVGAYTWDLLRTQFTANNINDHDISSIAIDGDGCLHRGRDASHRLLLYKLNRFGPQRESNQLVGGNDGNSTALNLMTGLYNIAVTYPALYNLPDGDLQLMYRNGSSGNGNCRLHRYDTATEQWSELGTGADDICLGRQEPGSSLPEVNSYPTHWLSTGPPEARSAVPRKVSLPERFLGWNDRRVSLLVRR